jgi:hypothetical protein
MLQAFLGINSVAKIVFINLILVQTVCVCCPWAYEREHYGHYYLHFILVLSPSISDPVTRVLGFWNVAWALKSRNIGIPHSNIGDPLSPALCMLNVGRQKRWLSKKILVFYNFSYGFSKWSYASDSMKMLPISVKCDQLLPIVFAYDHGLISQYGTPCLGLSGVCRQNVVANITSTFSPLLLSCLFRLLFSQKVPRVLKYCMES